MNIFTCGIPAILSLTIIMGVSNVHAQTISTAAGNGIAGYGGNGGPAIAANINLDTNLSSSFRRAGIGLDVSDNVYIADLANHVIRKVDGSGIISTIIGSGTAGYNGDGIHATDARLNAPAGVTVDAAGNIYIADRLNSRIRKVNSSGFIYTIAGTGTYGFSGDNGPATSAMIAFPNAIAVDAAGNVFFSDEGSETIRKVSTSGVISTIAGIPTLGGPGGYNGDFIPATNAQIYTPWGLAFDGSGNLYFADDNNNRVRKIDASGMISTVAGNGNATPTGVDNVVSTSTTVTGPRSIAFDAQGNYYIATNDDRVRKVNTAGIITTVAGTGVAGYNGDGEAATAAQLNRPEGVAVDASGNLYIADVVNARIRKVKLGIAGISAVSTDAAHIDVYPNPTNGVLRLNIPYGINTDAQIVITNMAGTTVKEFTAVTNKPCDVQMAVAPGQYIISATVDQHYISTQLVVE